MAKADTGNWTQEQIEAQRAAVLESDPLCRFTMTEKEQRTHFQAAAQLLPHDPWPREMDIGERISVLRIENERLLHENWQLKGALGYPVPADIRPGNFVCGVCAARKNESK